MKTFGSMFMFVAIVGIGGVPGAIANPDIKGTIQHPMPNPNPGVIKSVTRPHYGVIPGSYGLILKDATGKETDASSGSVSGKFTCPVTLLGHATLFAATKQGVKWSIKVEDGSPPAQGGPALAGGAVPPGEFNGKIAIQRQLSPAPLKNRKAEFDVYYLVDGGSNAFQMPVTLDIECNQPAGKQPPDSGKMPGPPAGGPGSLDPHRQLPPSPCKPGTLGCAQSVSVGPGVHLATSAQLRAQSTNPAKTTPESTCKQKVHGYWCSSGGLVLCRGSKIQAVQTCFDGCNSQSNPPSCAMEPTPNF